MSTPCLRCAAPMPDQAYVCRADAQTLAEALVGAAGHAEDAETVIARLAHYGAGSRGGSDEPLPVDLTASARYDAIQGVIGTWTRVVLEETGQDLPRWRPLVGAPCRPRSPENRVHWQLHRCPHASCETIRDQSPPPPAARAASWLATQVDWLRKHPAADEAFRALHNACEQLARLVDRPADKELVGMCDCGKVLYAPHGRTVVTCPVPTCKLNWEVAKSRDILRRALGDKLVTLPEAARLAAYLDSDRTQDGIRKLITARIGKLVAHAEIHGEPAYCFGEVITLLAAIPRRKQREAVV